MTKAGKESTTKRKLNAASHLDVAHRTIEIDGIEIFYRDAGPLDAPIVLLPHGYPSSSFQFRHFLPALADRQQSSGGLLATERDPSPSDGSGSGPGIPSVGRLSEVWEITEHWLPQVGIGKEKKKGFTALKP